MSVVLRMRGMRLHSNPNIQTSTFYVDDRDYLHGPNKDSKSIYILGKWTTYFYCNYCYTYATV